MVSLEAWNFHCITQVYFLALQNHCRWWLQPWNLKTLAPWKKNCDQPRQHITKQRHYFANKCSYKAMAFPVVMYDCESWTIKKAEHQRIDGFELWCWKRLKNPLDCKIKPVNLQGNQPWVFFGRTDTEAETPIFCPPDAKSCSLEKPQMLGKIEGRRKGW